MDIKELDKRQMVLLTLLITFVVSIATGIVTVSLMNQAPKSVPYTVNNVIQRTIEKVTTVTEDKDVNDTDNSKENILNAVSISKEGDILIKIYKTEINENNIVGDGVLISDSGLLLVDSKIIDNNNKYLVSLSSITLSANILKRFDNNFTILSLSEYKEEVKKEETETSKEENKNEDGIINETNPEIKQVDNITQ